MKALLQNFVNTWKGEMREYSSRATATAVCTHVPIPYATSAEATIVISSQSGATGVYNVAGLDNADRLLDTIGFHPDLNTAWDLIPYTFLINDAFAVADALDSLWPRGWVRSIPLHGWSHAKLNATVIHHLLPGHPYSMTQDFCTVDFELYYRQLMHGSNLEQLPPLATRAEFAKLPSMRTILNSLYLLSLAI